MSAPRRRMRRAAVLASLALASCTLYDGRPTVRLLPPGPIVTNGLTPLTLFVQSEVGPAHLLLDGEEIDGTVPVGQYFTHTLATPAVSEGEHVLVARVYDGARAAESDPVRIVLDATAPRLVGWSPASPAYSLAPFEATLRFDEPLGAASTAILHSTRPGGPGDVAVTCELSADGREIRVSAQQRLDDVSPVFARYEAFDRAGNRSEGTVSWDVPTLSGSFVTPSAGASVVREVVSIQASWSVAPAVDVLLDGAQIGRLDSPGATVALDTRSFPDGTHVLSLDAPGFDQIAPSARRTLRFDNTAPVLVRWEARSAADEDVGVRAGVDAVVSEPVCAAAPCWPAFAADRFHWAPVPWTAGAATWVVNLAGYVDLAGNPLAGPSTLLVPVPAWRRPWAAAEPGSLGAESVGIATVDPALAGRADLGMLVRLARPLGAADGAVALVRSEAPALWQSTGWLASTTGANATQLGTSADGRCTAWVEESVLGFRIRGARMLLGMPEYNFSVPTASRPVRLAAPARGTCGLGWTEVSAGGADTARVSWDVETTFGRVRQTVPVEVTPGASAVDLALGWKLDGWWIALVEALPGGKGQLRLVERSDTATEDAVVHGGVLNRDPARDAAQPSVVGTPWSATALAWIEDDQVLLRTMLPSGVWSEPAVMNAEPSAPARWPRLVEKDDPLDSRVYPLRLVFVETGPDGDRFEVRERASEGTWRSLESVPAGGDVVSFSVQEYPLAIAWTDAAGDVRLRLYNE